MAGTRDLSGLLLAVAAAVPLLAARAAAQPPPITFEQRVLELVNEERLAEGDLPPLSGDILLDLAAEGHSAAMAGRDFFAHCDPHTGTRPWDRMIAAGYLWSTAAENIAAGYATPENVMVGWMGSTFHRANILSPNYWEIGVGYVLEPGDQATVRMDGNNDCVPDDFGNPPFFRYWTQNFGRRNGVYPVVIDREAYDTTTASVDLYLYGEGWAQEVRLSSDGCSWSPWQPFSTETPWVLAAGGGTREVHAEIRNGATVRRSADEIILLAPCVAAENLDLFALTIDVCQVYEACDTIAAGDDFMVGPAGEVTFRAGDAIVLRDGFGVAAGGVFRAIVDPAIP